MYHATAVIFSFQNLMNNAMKMYSGMPQVLCEECCKHRFVASHPGIALRNRPQTICVSDNTFALPVQIVVTFLCLTKRILKNVRRK